MENRAGFFVKEGKKATNCHRGTALRYFRTKNDEGNFVKKAVEFLFRNIKPNQNN